MPPAQRAEQRAAAAQRDVIDTALERLGDLEEDGTLPVGTRDMMKRALDAAAEERVKHERTKDKLTRTEKRLTEIRAECEKTVCELRQHLGVRSPHDRAAGARLSYKAFCNDPYLQQRLGDYLYFDSIEAFDAYAALLDSYFPMEQIGWTKPKVPAGGGNRGDRLRSLSSRNWYTTKRGGKRRRRRRSTGHGARSRCA